MCKRQVTLKNGHLYVYLDTEIYDEKGIPCRKAFCINTKCEEGLITNGKFEIFSGYLEFYIKPLWESNDTKQTPVLSGIVLWSRFANSLNPPEWLHDYVKSKTTLYGDNSPYLSTHW